MIIFNFEVKLSVEVQAATATAAYKKLIEQLPTQNVSKLEMLVISQEEKKEPA